MENSSPSSLDWILQSNLDILENIQHRELPKGESFEEYFKPKYLSRERVGANRIHASVAYLLHTYMKSTLRNRRKC